MLNELSIKNMAIIDDLSVTFSEGLTVLSGETGAGKSIIINAVNLILGTRATSKLVRTGEESAEIEALFTINTDCAVADTMRELGHDPSDGLLIRRIISRNDRHKIYINGRLGTGQILSDITENLASISGQHAHQGLLKEEQHLLLLDQFANLMPIRETVRENYHAILPMVRQLETLRRRSETQAEHLELLEFQKQEIEEAAIEPNEDQALEELRQRLKHGEMLNSVARGSLEALYGMDGAVIEHLTDIGKQLEKAAGIDSALSEPAEEITDLCYRIEDIAGKLRDYADAISLDRSLLEETENRIDLLNRLKRKYGGTGGTLAEIDAHYATICNELSSVKNLSDTIHTLEAELGEAHRKLFSLAETLSEKRSRAAVTLSKKIETELGTLEMDKTRFTIALSSVEKDETTSRWLQSGSKGITETGTDKAVFMIAPNIGEAMKPLSKIASGGELSRVILAIKAILAKIDSVDTVVFDEVDAGIGGRTAEMVGKKIRDLSDYHQVICITHLPQIAKFAKHHYKIEKQVSGGRTRTSIRVLSEENRILEVARMLGGIEITEATLEHAREMIESAS